jgi:UDP-N-acetylglucosamine 2-epimerase
LEGVADKYSKTGVGQAIDWTKKYLLVIQHPVTTEFGSGYKQIEETIKAIDKLNIQTVWLWPNVDAGSDDISKGLRVYRERKGFAPVQFFRNFTVEDYAKILNNASCAIGNSSSFIREGAFIGTPTVLIGTRQNGREQGNNAVFVGYDCDEIVKAVQKQIQVQKYPPSNIFGNGDAGDKIANLLSLVSPPVQKKFFQR